MTILYPVESTYKPTFNPSTMNDELIPTLLGDQYCLRSDDLHIVLVFTKYSLHLHLTAINTSFPVPGVNHPTSDMRFPLAPLVLALSLYFVRPQEISEDNDLDTEPAVDAEVDSEEVGPSHTIFSRSGPMKGRRVSSNGKIHYEFLGVPYAEPPVGDLSYLPPLPVQPWLETLEATQDGSPCLQPRTEFSGLGDLSSMSEDCLTLNIFTTDLDGSKPVMFWIHGGGFTSGSKDLYRMRALIEEDVVLVTINYRLHALGFLSFGNDIVSGNMGLKDQHLALQWVRYNIHRFGGDPDRLTVFGESAGGGSVQAQVLSPYNAGLLSGAIAQSGSVLYLSVEEEGREVRAATEALKALGCPTSLDMRSLECLQGLDMSTMMANITDDPRAFMDPDIESKFQFAPVIDSYSSHPFLPLDPLEALKTGQYNRVPYITGTVKNEGALLTGGIRLTGRTGQEILDTVLRLGESGPLAYFGLDQTTQRLAAKVYNHSTGDKQIELEQPAVDLLTDTWFGSYDQKSVELMSGYSRRVYNYYLTQQTNNSLIGQKLGLSVEYTPVHGDDLAFLITENTLDASENLSEEEKTTARMIIKYWTNFAKFGDPSPRLEVDVPVWYPATPNRMVSCSLTSLSCVQMISSLPNLFNRVSLLSGFEL